MERRPKEWEFETITITQEQFDLLVLETTQLTIDVAREQVSHRLGGHYPLWPAFAHELDELFLEHGNLIAGVLKGEIK